MYYYIQYNYCSVWWRIDRKHWIR